MSLTLCLLSNSVRLSEAPPRHWHLAPCFHETNRKIKGNGRFANRFQPRHTTVSDTQDEVRTVERAEAAARLSMVETFYGDDSRLEHNAAIAHTAAEHARAALRVASPLEAPLVPGSNQHNPQEHESLFKWLGITEPTPPGDGDESILDGEFSAEDAGEEWTLPFADYEIEEAAPEVIEAPSSLWTPWPRGRLAPKRPRNRGRLATPDPATRAVSAVATFGSVPMRAQVERWVAGSRARQEQLRRLMVSPLSSRGSVYPFSLCVFARTGWCLQQRVRPPRFVLVLLCSGIPRSTRCMKDVPQSSPKLKPQAVEERELSKAWVALWGRRLRLDPSTKAWVYDNDGDDAAVRSAARRVMFLEGHPEQVRTSFLAATGKRRPQRYVPVSTVARHCSASSFAPLPVPCILWKESFGISYRRAKLKRSWYYVFKALTRQKNGTRAYVANASSRRPPSHVWFLKLPSVRA